MTEKERAELMAFKTVRPRYKFPRNILFMTKRSIVKLWIFLVPERWRDLFDGKNSLLEIIKRGMIYNFIDDHIGHDIGDTSESFRDSVHFSPPGPPPGHHHEHHHEHHHNHDFGGDGR